jgi:Arylsulfotransferase (ASST)
MLTVVGLAWSVASLWIVNPARAARAIVVFPIPGSHYGRPATQITFRGIPATQIGELLVVGSKTGVHKGRVRADADGQGGSFIPGKRFAPGETVTVGTHLHVLGGTQGVFRFTIAHARLLLGFGPLLLAPAGSHGVQRFRSRPDLRPASVAVTQNAAPVSEGDIFLAPQNGPSQNGPLILDPHGRLIWFLPYPVGTNTLITDFRVQRLDGQPVLTWWQGSTSNGLGRGTGVIYNHDYRRIATVRAGNGLAMDLHEFLVTPKGDAYIVASSPVSVPSLRKPVIDEAVQEIEIKTGLVLFEWHALDHIRLRDSYFTPRQQGYTYDPFHINSVAVDRHGNLFISARNTSAVYKVDPRTGKVIWRLGGKRSSFRMGTGTETWGQHDALVQPDGTVTAFDDGAGPPRVHPYSRGIRETVDPRHRVTRLLKEYDHSPALSANFEGGLQLLGDGDIVMGWGQQPYFSEDDAAGKQILDAHFVEPTTTYRVYRFQWSAQPPTPPAIAATLQPDGHGTLYASWNGATDVTGWRVLAGSTVAALRPISRTARSGFETALAAHSPGPYFAVQALGSRGRVLATSPVRRVAGHLAIFGASSFVAPGGTATVPVGCYTAGPRCLVAVDVSAGRTVIARSGTQLLPAGGGGLLHFRLSPAGRALLAHAPRHRLAAQVTAEDSSGETATAALTLIPFRTSGPGPPRSASSSGPIEIAGGTEFVSGNGVGGILVHCLSATPCDARATVSAGRTTLARTGARRVDAAGLGYLIFTLTGKARALLAHAAGNQLAATVTVTAAGATATANVALVAFS